jgi:hypothetical protein
MFVHLDAERLANRYDQVVLVELGVTLDRIVLNVFRDVAQFGQRLMF